MNRVLKVKIVKFYKGIQIALFFFVLMHFLRTLSQGILNFVCECTYLKHLIKLKNLLYLLHLGHLLGHTQALLAHEAAAFVKDLDTFSLIFFHPLLH